MSSSAFTGHPMTPELRKAIVKWIVGAALGWAGYAVLLFLSAGTLKWAWGWVLLGVLAAFLAAHPLLLIPLNPELLAEREKGLRDPRVKSWDRWVAMLGGGLLPILSWLVAGLDRRFQWTGPFPLIYHLGGLLAMLLGFALFLWAMVANAYFSEGVRIQEERGHQTATGGPYRFVRHPGYAGAMLSMAATPLLLGSVWALLPGLAAALTYVVRTRLEDKTLIEELPGYREYTAKTRYRLLPGVW